jgi:hypothetical protein
LLAAAFLAVIVVLPPEGRIMAPVHNELFVLFGRATFVLPVGLALLGGLLLVLRLRPAVRLPTRRFIGVGLLALVALAGESLLASHGDGTGLVGDWLSGMLLDLLGTPITVMVLLVLLAAGTLLAFDLRWRVPAPPRPPDAAS